MKQIWDAFVGSAPGFVLLGGGFMFITTAIMRKELDSFREKLNGTYLRKELAEQKFKEIEQHFDWIRDNYGPVRPVRPSGD